MTGLRGWRGVAMLLSLWGLSGCALWNDSVGYYWQSASGHLAVMRAARPIDQWLSDSATPDAMRKKLAMVQQARRFAVQALGLPDNDSYTKYADLKRPYVVWSVVATPELSLQLKQWCFPVAGCVTYRGYYEQAAADSFATRLRAEGDDVQVGGVPAYSTLGYFDDPVLNTFINYPDAEVARLLFHELSHQVVYLPGDSRFNESFATTVEEAGLERWLVQQADPQLRARYAEFDARKRDFRDLLKRYRARLDTLYQSTQSEATKRAGKQSTLAELRADYQTLKSERWGGFAGYDRFFAQPLGNAHLAAVGTYTELVPAFKALLREAGNDLPAFYVAARQLAEMPKADREARIAQLMARQRD